MYEGLELEMDESVQNEIGFNLEIEIKNNNDDTKKSVVTTQYRVPKGYHYTTGFWHGWILRETPNAWYLYVQEKCQCDDFKTSTFVLNAFERSRLEFKMAELFWKWSQR